MGHSLSRKLVDKAHAAICAAIEIYNKPAFPYKEETFSLLTINAWELLLKARILNNNNHKLKSIRVYEKKRTKKGVPTKKEYLVRTRSGNARTVSIGQCMTLLESTSSKLPTPLVANIRALVEIRDTAVHFVVASPVLMKQVLEIGTASVKNFIHLCKKWFDVDFSDSLALVLPISFVSGRSESDSVSVCPAEDRLIKYLQTLAQNTLANDPDCQVAIRVSVNLERSKLDTASKIEITKDPNALKVTLTEEDIRNLYPWDYKQLVKRLAARYAGFKQDEKFHLVKKEICKEEKFCRTRYLDPRNTKSSNKMFYSPNIVQEFDKHYQQAKAAS